MGKVKLQYTGTRSRAFSVPCPSGERYPIEPVVSPFIYVAEVDADFLLATEGTVWKKVEPDVPAPAEAEGEEPSAPTTRSVRQRRQVNTDDGKS